MAALYKDYCKETVDGNGRLLDIEVFWPDNFNFGYDIVDRYAALEPDKRALVWCNVDGQEATFTFSDISRLSNKAANVLLKNGIKKGDKVILALKRHYEYWYISVALCKIGAIMIPVTHMLTVSDYKYRLEASKAKAIITTSLSDVAETALEAVNALGMDTTVYTVQKAKPGCRFLSEEIDAASDQLERLPTRWDEIMSLYFTSGTTGYPKGVMHNQAYPLCHIVTAKYWQCAEDNGLHYTISETGWAKASWGKIYGQWLVGSAVMVHDFDIFDPRQVPRVINKYGVTSFCAPSTVYRYMVKKAIKAMPTLKHAATAGEYLDPAVFTTFKEQTGLTIKEAYGQTETGLLTGNFCGMPSKDSSLGVATPLYDVQIVDKANKPVGPGVIGEIVVKPKEGRRLVGILSGYLDNDELYQSVWEGGIYHTGDSAWMDEDGHFWFHGRFDDIIKSGGFRIGPYEIENVLARHPAVLECSAVGIPDEKRGQAVKVFVTLADGYKPTHELEKEIKEFTNSQLATYKWIRVLEFVDEMPKTISGKTRKIEQREAEEKIYEDAHHRSGSQKN